jgi:hypothetical protein
MVSFWRYFKNIAKLSKPVLAIFETVKNDTNCFGGGGCKERFNCFLKIKLFPVVLGLLKYCFVHEKILHVST